MTDKELEILMHGALMEAHQRGEHEGEYLVACMACVYNYNVDKYMKGGDI